MKIESCINEAVHVYNESARLYFDKYEAVSFEEAHKDIKQLLPRAPARILDIGSGSGRDAAALSKMGYEVFAVEPSSGMRNLAKKYHGDSNVIWLDDQLPELKILKDKNIKFRVVMLSAIWMHLHSNIRAEAFENLTKILDANGLLILTLRLGPEDEKRVIHSVSVEEIKSLANEHKLNVIFEKLSDDVFNRSDIKWATLIFAK